MLLVASYLLKDRKVGCHTFSQSRYLLFFFVSSPSPLHQD